VRDLALDRDGSEGAGRKVEENRIVRVEIRERDVEVDLAAQC
jgi:hypothetical protein